MKITTILNCYKRPQYLKEQIEAIQSQTIPSEIIIWYNKPKEGMQYDIAKLGVKTITCNHNFKFHGRFAAALLARTEYVALFDDDTIPGNKWYENCLNCESQNSGIYGTSGVILHKNSYNPNHKVGWNGVPPNEEIQEVDLVGHAWFMKKENLEYMWREEPVSWENGEDMQLSYCAQKYGNVRTFVPPHPKNDIEMWGSKKGMEYGNDFSASWRRGQHMALRDQIASEQICRGWKTIRSSIS